MCCSLLMAAAQDKQQALDKLREQYAKTSFRAYERKTIEPFDDCRKLLLPDGRFSDFIEKEKEILDQKMPQSKYSREQGQVAGVTVPAFRRIWQLAEPFRQGLKDDVLKENIYKAIIHYGKLEDSRVNVPSRFHGSCFAIPAAAINTYFCFFQDMEAVENGKEKSELIIETNRILRIIGYQAWTVPARGDATDRDVVSVERFRKHVWWVGGNGVTYRPALPAAIMMNSIPMVDVVAEVGKGAISNVSQSTFDDAFWTEGMTADGAGWGHGMQCIIWGYPAQGTVSALDILNQLRDTPWASELERSQVEALLNFFRGGAFYFYKGYTPLGLSRHMLFPLKEKGKIPTLSLMSNVVKNWSQSLTDAEHKELSELVKLIQENDDAFPADTPPGFYHGSRWFFNNDDMIHKNPDFMIFVNMSSFRVDGMESAWPVADGFNFFVTDGATMFMRDGTEYGRSIGAIDLTAWPGVTTRRTPVELKPIVNWRGYCSTFNFAAGATTGKDFAAGYIYRKMNASDKENGNGQASAKDPNPTIFGVLAYKSYFLFGKTFMALGAGITNEKTEFDGTIQTTLDQSPAIDCREENGWQLNNGFAFRVLPEFTTGKVLVQREKRRTDWKKLSARGNKNAEDYDIDIFQMAIDHGKDARNATYAYVVQCDGNTSAAMPQVLSNTSKLQAAQSADGSSIGAVFFDAEAELKAPQGIFKVSAPCTLLAEITKDRITLTISDAEMNTKLTQITVTTPWKTVEITVPTGAQCGKPVSVTIIR